MFLTLCDDGSLSLEDDSGVGLWDTWAVDDEGGLSAQLFPQGVEDYLRAAFGTDAGLRIAVDAVDLELQVSNGPGGPEMDVTLGLTAGLTYCDPDARQTVKRKLTYEASASGPPN